MKNAQELIFTKNQNLINLLQEVQKHLAEKRMQKSLFSYSDILNPQTQYYFAYQLPKKIEFLRRVTSDSEQQTLLLGADEFEKYQRIITLIKEQAYLLNTLDWSSIANYPRVKHLIVHAYLQDDISEDDMIDSIAILDLRSDCEKYGNDYFILKLMDKNAKPSAELVELCENANLTEYQIETFYNALKHNKSSWGYVIKKHISCFTDSLTSVYCLPMRNLFYVDYKFLILSNSAFRAFISNQQGQDTVLVRPVLGISAFKSIASSLLEGFRDYALTLDSIKSLKGDHENLSYNIYHDRFHVWKCSSIPKGMRNSFLYIASLFQKLSVVLEQSEKDIVFGSFLVFSKTDTSLIKRLRYYAKEFVDQEFAGRFGRESNQTEQAFKDYKWILQNLPEQFVNLVLLDATVNYSFWKQTFDLKLDLFIKDNQQLLKKLHSILNDMKLQSLVKDAKIHFKKILKTKSIVKTNENKSVVQSFNYRSAEQSTANLLMNHWLWRQYDKTDLENKRHNNQQSQEQYDQQYALIPFST